jgi:hypothetical protein
MACPYLAILVIYSDTRDNIEQPHGKGQCKWLLSSGKQREDSYWQHFSYLSVHPNHLGILFKVWDLGEDWDHASLTSSQEILLLLLSCDHPWELLLLGIPSILGEPHDLGLRQMWHLAYIMEESLWSLLVKATPRYCTCSARYYSP